MNPGASKPMKRRLVIVGLVFSILAALYSLGGVMVALWVSAVPGNSPEHIRLNFLIWVPATIVFSVLSIVFVRILIKAWK